MSVDADAVVQTRAEWTGATVPVSVGAATPGDALAWASKHASVEDVSSQVGFLLQHVGPRVTWAALGLKDPRMLTKWWQGGRPKSEDMVQRVLLLFQACYAITAVFDGATAARFLRVRSPFLGYESPGELLRSGTPEEVGKRFLGAADHFLNA